MRLELLDQPIPTSAVTQRKQSGVMLDYLEGWYVIDRLNKVFGPLGWEVTIQSTDRVQQEQKPKANGPGENWYVGYLAHVRLTIVGSEGFQTVDKEDFGFGQGIDNDLGKAHESAIKEAVTDALKRCAKDLGMSMGLALYDKSKTNVVHPVPAPSADERVKKHLARLIPANSDSETDKKAVAEPRRKMWDRFCKAYQADAANVLLGCDDLKMAEDALAAKEAA